MIRLIDIFTSRLKNNECPRTYIFLSGCRFEFVMAHDSLVLLAGHGLSFALMVSELLFR